MATWVSGGQQVIGWILILIGDRGLGIGDLDRGSGILILIGWIWIGDWLDCVGFSVDF